MFKTLTIQIPEDLYEELAEAFEANHQGHTHQSTDDLIAHQITSYLLNTLTLHNFELNKAIIQQSLQSAVDCIKIVPISSEQVLQRLFPEKKKSLIQRLKEIFK